MNLECRYREPQPTKKDKTLVEILDRIKNIEGKVESINLRGALPLPGFESHQQTTAVQSSYAPESAQSETWEPSTDVQPSAAAIGSSSQTHYAYASAAYKTLSWPFVQQVLESSKHPGVNLAPLLKENGSAVMLGLHAHAISLPVDTVGSALSTDGTPSLDGGLVTDHPAGDLRLESLSMSWEGVHRFSKAYFDTFNRLYPIMDRDLFQAEILASVASSGFSEGTNATLAFLVMALGEVALAGVQGSPLTQGSGVKGGTLERPPGLALFNEARKRLGFCLTQCSIENVQVFALASLYYQSCCRHTDFWRMTISASLACQALLTSHPEELTSHRADLIRRLFWHCIMMETYLNLEFNIPLTGLEKLESLVGLPDFSAGSFSEDDYAGNQTSHFREHFASQIVLRRLSVEFHTTLSNAFGPAGTQAVTGTIKQLSVQLDQWRGMLPSYLCWQEGQGENISTLAQSAFPPHISGLASSYVFATDLNIHAAAADIQVAILRTRYYYARYLVHRPYLYKALHHPESMTHEDAEGVAIALKSILLWPITMSPIRDQKRLVPCLFCWSQNLLGNLIMLHLSQQVPILIRVRATHLGDRFDLDAKRTTSLYIDWIRDLKDVDATALWCWTVLKAVYPLEE